VTTFAGEYLQEKRLKVAREIGHVLNREAEAGVRAGSITPDVVEAILDSGLMKIGVATEVGGEACSYAEWAAVLEELARADGSAGWCYMATSSHAASFSAVLPDAGVEAFYADGIPPVIAGMPAPRGRAERVEGGYLFTGKHQFASGSALADHFVGGGVVHDSEGTPIMASNGAPEMIAVIIPRDEVRLLGNWNVTGLEATASIDFEIGPIFVEEGKVVHVNPWPTKVYRGTSFWALGVEILGPLGHCAPALGVSKRALQEVAALAPTRKRVDAMFPTVGDQPLFRHDLVARWADLQATHLLWDDLLRRLDDWTEHNDAAPPRELVDRAKYVARHIHDTALKCVDFAYHWSGTVGLRSEGVVGRCFRNVHAMDVHIAVDRNNFVVAADSVMPLLAEGAADFA
jgi:alkylation response protein AidB-like acyl-CoA dehydrogenase